MKYYIKNTIKSKINTLKNKQHDALFCNLFPLIGTKKCWAILQTKIQMQEWGKV